MTNGDDPTPRRSKPVGVAILGSTGSVGRQTLEVIDHHPDRFRVVALAAGSNVALLRTQAARYRPDLVALQAGRDERHGWPATVELGGAGLVTAATHPDADIIVVATSGHAAMLPTYHAIAAGKTIALANKETIVCAGEIVVPFAKARGVQIRPVDSEHSAIWQCLDGTRPEQVARLVLTASGGPFREAPRERLATVTVADALSHPTWSMGGKITIDSASLMNKGLEVIEARWLFDVPYDRIEVVIHPESIVHSLVEFVDGSQLAQLGLPDMRVPIQFALTYPDRIPGPGRRLSLSEAGVLHFEAPDEDRFPALGLARQAGQAGGTYPTVLSAADEVAIEAFIAGVLRFVDIPAVVGETLAAHQPITPLDFEAIAAADDWARRTTLEVIRGRGTGSA